MTVAVDAPVDPPAAHRPSAGSIAVTALLFAGLLFVLAFPLLVALVELRRPHWYPLLDMAQTEIRVRDVTAHTPLIGLAGRIGPFGPNGGSHPGPLSFYALWPVWKLFGGSSYGLFASTVVLDIVAMGLSLWMALRRGGRTLLIAIAAVLAVLTRAYGAFLLTLPWNPYLPVLWWFVFLLAVWSVLADDLAMLPVAVIAGSMCMQTHISYLGLIGGLAAFTVAVARVERVQTPARSREPAGVVEVGRYQSRHRRAAVDPAGRSTSSRTRPAISGSSATTSAIRPTPRSAPGAASACCWRSSTRGSC